MKSNNQINIPQAREAGSVGGQMVKNTLPERTKFYIRKNRIKEGHCSEIRYIFRMSL